MLKLSVASVYSVLIGPSGIETDLKVSINRGDVTS